MSCTHNYFVSRPLYLKLNLDLRQGRKHFHGQLFFQAIVLPDDFFDLEGTDTSDEETEKKSMAMERKLRKVGDTMMGHPEFLLIYIHQRLF
jgi:hypothetical protein